MQFGLQNHNQTNNNVTGNSFLNPGTLHTGSNMTSLGSNFTNSPAVQTFGNVGAGSSYGVTQNINYSQPNASIGAPLGTPAGLSGFPQTPVAAPAPAPVPATGPLSQPSGGFFQAAQSLPTQYPPQNYYYAPQPQQAGGSSNNSEAGLIQAILAPVMQMMTLMITTLMQNGSFVGPQFKGDIDFKGENGVDEAAETAVDEVPFEEEIIEEEIVVDKGKVWGDPHFVGAEGGKYDVMGSPGKIYNILSDQSIQFNAKFDKYKGQDDATIMSQAGLTIGNDQIEYGIDGKLLINGEEMKDGSYLEGKIVKKGANVTINTSEWTVVLKDNGDHLNYDFTSGNAVADGVRPHGLFGQSADGDGKVRNGDEGKGAQGGGAIEKTDGTITEKGDKETYKAYEVSDLFDTDFENFNKFHHQANPNAPKAKAKVKVDAQGGGDPK